MQDKIKKEIINELLPNEYSTEQSVIKNYCIDWRGDFEGTSDIILFPSSVAKISRIVKICNKKKIPIVPQGGNTSLVGGSVPRKNKGEIILNLSKLNRIRKINLIDYTITLESGCILENVKKELEYSKMVFPLSMGSKGSCQIGGNIATNAGGVNVIKYGSLRSNILGLEIITYDGEVVSELNDIKKNNTGLDLKQLFIGSEGILGIITAATMKIFNQPKERNVLWIALKDFKQTLNLFSFITKTFNDQITSFEIMNKKSISIIKEIEIKFDVKNYEFFCLVEISNFQGIENFYEYIVDRLKKINYSEIDMIISKSESENQKIWNIRESIPIEEKKHGYIIKHDISIPLEKMEEFIINTENQIKKYDNKAEVINFGHLGDNNLHYNVMIKDPNKVQQKKTEIRINEIIFNNVRKCKGSISAEHGIGQLRKKDLLKFRGGNEIKKMKLIKNAFDPNNIFNPGKIF